MAVVPEGEGVPVPGVDKAPLIAVPTATFLNEFCSFEFAAAPDPAAAGVLPPSPGETAVVAPYVVEVCLGRVVVLCFALETEEV
jgi:hypothetical protein